MDLLINCTPMTDLLRERGIFERHPFVLIDVGCVGGLPPEWRIFGPTLLAHGFDPDVAACEAARAEEAFACVHYQPRFVGLSASHSFVQRRRSDQECWPDTNIWSRVTAGQLAAADAERMTAPKRLADPSTLIGVDDFVRGEAGDRRLSQDRCGRA